ncbi:MAG: YbaN family protein [Steroidobacteraceae bacterium]|nr:YbaN family protein [Steroidobacteraceae bacterium]
MEHPPDPGSRTARLWRAFGTLSVAIGLFNAFVPLLPTTVFLLVGLWAYGKGAPDLRERLLEHPRFGPGLRLWQERRSMTRLAKWQCIGTIAFGYLVTVWLAGFSATTALLGIGLAGLALYLALRPEPAACPLGAPQR